MPLEPTRPELADLVAALAAADVPVAVGGSRALSASRSESDYDLVIYGKDSIERAAKVITGLAGYASDVHFGLDFRASEYRHFTRLSAEDVAVLVGDRWRHFRHRGLPMSVDGADPDRVADRWASVSVRAEDPGHLRGFVLDGAQCYLSPKIIDVRTETGTVRVFTWLNLYAGALRTDDEVEVTRARGRGRGRCGGRGRTPPPDGPARKLPARCGGPRRDRDSAKSLWSAEFSG